MRALLCNLLLFLLVQVSYAKQYNVRSANELQSLSPALAAGDEVLIADGVYRDWSVVLSAVGSLQQPVMIRAKNPGKVVFTGNVSKPVFLVRGKYIMIRDLVFEGCALMKDKGGPGRLVDLMDSRSCRVSNCRFTNNLALAQFMPLVIISGKGMNNRVDSCAFIRNKDCQDLQVKVSKEAWPMRTQIDNNLFKDKPKLTWKVRNGGECVQVGQDPVLLGYIQTFALVERNTFINCDAESEVISNKSSGNRYSNNALQGCSGELVMRGGHDCILDSNRISGGGGGIRVNGSGHRIEYNQIDSVGTAIRLMYGMAKGKKENGFYIAASQCTVRYNRIRSAKTGILIGDGKDKDWSGKFNTSKYPSRVFQDVAPFGNDIRANIFENVGTTLKRN